MSHKTIFISYSRDDQQHMDWVRTLANELITQGLLEVILDQYDLKIGNDPIYFMEKAMLADKVVMILTPNYKLKADKREGGVGAEYSLISQALYDGVPDQTRFIPVLRVGEKNTSCPSFMKNRMFFDMKDDRLFDLLLFDLIKILKDEPITEKPTLGQIPSFEVKHFPDLEKSFFELQKKEEISKRRNTIINSTEGVLLFKKTILNIVEQINLHIDNHINNFGLSVKKVTNNTDNISFTTGNYTTTFIAKDCWADTVCQANVDINLYDGFFGFEKIWYEPNYFGNKLLYTANYKFSLDDNLNPVFIKTDNPNIKITANDLATSIVRDIVIKERELRLRKIN